jgi:hypothetical protein
MTILQTGKAIPRPSARSGGIRALLFFCLLAAAPVPAVPGEAPKPCRIEVVEKGSGWPVPLVELRTTHQLRFVTDNAGLVAMDAPELMNREVWFEIKGHGYGVPKDGFGYSGVRLRPVPGGRLRVEVERTILARRLGRLTGAGLFAESQKLGERLDEPESGESGCDSVQTAVCRGTLFWMWGDTTLAKYPLGIYDTTGATSSVPAFAATPVPPLRPPFARFRDASGAVRGVAPMPGEGPTWISGLVALRDKDGRERLCASFVKVKPPLDAYRCGQCVWDDAAAAFKPLQVLWEKSALRPRPPRFTDGHPVSWTDSDGRRWLLFGDPFPRLQCPATFEGWRDPSSWRELKPQPRVAARDGRSVRPHTGSILWSGYRKCWVAVFMENGGKPSEFGELWYAEASSPFGPWGGAVKILTHDNYTFYNPLIHGEGMKGDEPYILFEGTYTQTFAKHPEPTPRYDYTQILYRLDLDDVGGREVQITNYK